MEYSREFIQAHTYVSRWLKDTPSWMTQNDACTLYNAFDARIKGVENSSIGGVPRCLKILNKGAGDYAAIFVARVVLVDFGERHVVAGRCDLCGRIGVVYQDSKKNRLCAFCGGS